MWSDININFIAVAAIEMTIFLHFCFMDAVLEEGKAQDERTGPLTEHLGTVYSSVRKPDFVSFVRDLGNLFIHFGVQPLVTSQKKGFWMNRATVLRSSIYLYPPFCSLTMLIAEKQMFHVFRTDLSCSQSVCMFRQSNRENPGKCHTP